MVATWLKHVFVTRRAQVQVFPNRVTARGDPLEHWAGPWLAIAQHHWSMKVITKWCLTIVVITIAITVIIVVIIVVIIMLGLHPELCCIITNGTKYRSSLHSEKQGALCLLSRRYLHKAEPAIFNSSCLLYRLHSSFQLNTSHSNLSHCCWTIIMNRDSQITISISLEVEREFWSHRCHSFPHRNFILYTQTDPNVNLTWLEWRPNSVDHNKPGKTAADAKSCPIIITKLIMEKRATHELLHILYALKMKEFNRKLSKLA